MGDDARTTNRCPRWPQREFILPGSARAADRAIRLGDDGRSLLLANGLEYAPFPAWREPSATIIIREIKGKPDRQLIRASVEKAAWRELHALTVKAAGDYGIGGPAALANVLGEKAFDIWVGGLVASRAKLVDTTESVFHVPAAMLASGRGLWA